MLTAEFLTLIADTDVVLAARPVSSEAEHLAMVDLVKRWRDYGHDILRQHQRNEARLAEMSGHHEIITEPGL